MIRVRNLTKNYGERVAVDDISFDVGGGEIVGFLGPNGAGKTTTMRILTGSLMPNRGEVQIAGRDMLRDSRNARRHVGYLPELAPLYLEMTTRGYLEFAARLRGLDRRQARRRVEELTPLCGIADYIDVVLGKLSKGYRQRVGLAQAIVHDPKVLILDEPTAGIDPIQVAQTKALIAELGRDRTILLSTHILPEASAICERVVIIQAGRIVAEDRIGVLAEGLATGKRLRLTVQGPPEAVTASLLAIASVRDMHHEAPFHILTYDAASEPQAEIARTLSERGWTLLAMESVPISLESIFLDLTARERVAK